MRRGIDFLIVVVVTFYIAIIYESKALVYLGCAEIVFAMLLVLYNLFVLFQIRISLEVPLNVTECGKMVPVKIRIQNYSIFPTGKISIQLTESHTLFWKKRKAVFYASAEGRGNEWYSTTVIKAEWYSNYSGKAEISLKKAMSFDLLGILALPLPKRAYRSREEITVLPAFYEIPIDIGNKAREFLAEQERYRQSVMEDTVTEQFQIRGYQPGDRIRNIHWKLSAKEDDLMVRESIPVISCPVLLFLNMAAQKKESGKKLLQKRDRLFSVLLSISISLVQQKCSHFVIWYDEGDVVRYRVEKEEDIYTLLMKISKITQYPQGVSIEEEYYQKYRERVLSDRIVLDWNLHLICNGELEIVYDDKNLKESLLTQEIFL